MDSSRYSRDLCDLLCYSLRLSPLVSAVVTVSSTAMQLDGVAWKIGLPCPVLRPWCFTAWVFLFAALYWYLTLAAACGNLLKQPLRAPAAQFLPVGGSCVSGSISSITHRYPLPGIARGVSPSDCNSSRGGTLDLSTSYSVGRLISLARLLISWLRSSPEQEPFSVCTLL